MGRKIPAKKHRGVKDPLIQQARRLETLKSKINAPPKDPDEQPVPRSLTRLFAFQSKRDKNDTVNKNKQNVKRKSHAQVGHNSSYKERNPISNLRRLPGESGRDFSLRINSAVKALHNPVEDMNYPQDIEVDDVKGDRMAAQRERRARKRKREKKGKDTDEPQLTRTQKFALKKKEKKMKALQVSEEKREVVYERVTFGEVTHAPPALHFKHKLLQRDADAGAPRPGRRDLLLTELLRGGGGAGAGAGSAGAGAGSAGAGAGSAGAGAGAGAGAADAARRERARLDAVAAYRALKAAKIKDKNK